MSGDLPDSEHYDYAAIPPEWLEMRDLFRHAKKRGMVRLDTGAIVSLESWLGESPTTGRIRCHRPGGASFSVPARRVAVVLVPTIKAE